MSDKIQLFAKKKGSAELPQPIEIKNRDIISTPVKGLLRCTPSAFKCQVEITTTPKAAKDLNAALQGYTRITPIKRTRKRQIKRAKLMGLTPYQKKIYRCVASLTHAFVIASVSASKLFSKQKRPSVTNRKRWK